MSRRLYGAASFSFKLSAERRAPPLRFVIETLDLSAGRHARRARHPAQFIHRAAGGREGATRVQA
jgi:hypothetical protein